MDAAKIQSKVIKGYAKAAQRIGFAYAVYRVPGTDYGAKTTIAAARNAAFTPHSSAGFNFLKPSDHKNPMVHCLADVSDNQVGDYYVGAATYFLAGLDPLFPPLAIRCNRVVTFSRRAKPTVNGNERVKGFQPEYAGSINYGPSDNTPAFLTGFPCALLKGSRGIRDTTLPEDVGQGMFTLLLPPVSGSIIQPSDTVRDDLGNDYSVQMAELTSYCWQVILQQDVI